MESIKRDILGCAPIAVVKPSQGCSFSGQWPRWRGASGEDTHLSILGETALFAGRMLLPPGLHILISGKCSKTGAEFSGERLEWKPARREVGQASPGRHGPTSIEQAGGCGKTPGSPGTHHQRCFRWRRIEAAAKVKISTHLFASWRFRAGADCTDGTAGEPLPCETGERSQRRILQTSALQPDGSPLPFPRRG